MAKINLTQASIKSSKPREKQYWLDSAAARRGRGRLSVLVMPSGIKTYYFTYYLGKAKQAIKLGNVPKTAGAPGMTLSSAFAKAEEYGDLLSNGVDPREYIKAQIAELQRREAEERRNGSLQQLFDCYAQNMADNGRRTYRRVHRDLVNETAPVFDLEDKAKRFKTEHAVEILGRMIDRGAEVQSNRVRAFLHAAFQYGLHHDNDPKRNRNGSLFGLSHNPVSNIPRQKSAERALDRNLSGAELSRLLRDLDDIGHFNRSNRVFFLAMIYTGQRVEEVARLRWEDLDLSKGIWSVHPDRSKVGASYIVPIAPELRDALVEQREIAANSALVFPKRNDPTQHIDATTPSQALKRYFTRIQKAHAEGERGVEPWSHFTARDLRRTFKTRLGEIGVSKSIRDQLQAHQLGDTSSKHYDRYDYLKEKLAAINVWSDALEQWKINSDWTPS
ncbi:tyrosine-type recombinase/integrase [Ferrimonas futtsuensis]|uniref:tyrosine-type recombinase/integrase n=1 Tax=Ferrimonas futtsuensis TaxID=364764 RepID=UPI0003FF3C4F|nr:site-specific integrase [Ferrimonas futtsuensis]